MKCEVKLYIAGKVFSEIVIAKDYNSAKTTALARNPTAKVVSVSAVFNWYPDASLHQEQITIVLP